MIIFREKLKRPYFGVNLGFFAQNSVIMIFFLKIQRIHFLALIESSFVQTIRKKLVSGFRQKLWCTDLILSYRV